MFIEKKSFLYVFSMKKAKVLRNMVTEKIAFTFVRFLSNQSNSNENIWKILQG